MVESPERPDPVAARLGDALRQARIAVDISGAELARRLGVIPQELNRWEMGRRKVSLETILEAEQALKVRAGTVLRLAGFVDDGGLVDVATLAPWAQRSVSLIIEDAKRRKMPGADNGDGSESAE
jgi:transcriptional regulator with XRE-family HTH domain